jgi:hypothetical protein
MESNSIFGIQIRYNVAALILTKSKVRDVEVVRPVEKKRESSTGGLLGNPVAALEYTQPQAVFAAKIMKCVTRAFDAIGASSAMQEVIFWNLHVTRNLGRSEIIDKPAEFIEGLKAIYGEAGVVVFEYEMTKEIKREFGLTTAFDNEPAKARNLLDLLHLVAYLTLESQGNV